RLDALAADVWDRLSDDPSPFVRHAWLSGLESHHCLGADSGWEPQHLIAESEHGEVLGAVPLYLKHHSYGEFVFDFAWADASHRLGKTYYPKLLCAIPFVPSTGPRLLARDPAVRAALAAELARSCQAQQLSSAHLLFADDADAQTLLDQGWLERHDVQFQWLNRGYADFPAFVAQLNSEKRKKLLRERRRVAEAGIHFEVRCGHELDEAEWARVYALYANTYLQRGQPPYFTPEFLHAVGTDPSLDMRLVFALHEGHRVAVAITLIGGDTLYGRHWGCEAHYHSLHFECCYYQGIELCLQLGLQRFDAGTQGAHKHARGFEPVKTRSLHHLTDPRLHQAVADYLRCERQAVAARQSEFMHHTPYRADPSPALKAG
ncbi:MAG: GNAT family N-acetyltransferase, partial [Panacagrimonas sp.]